MKNLFIIIFTLFFSLYSSSTNASIELVSHESLVNLKDKKILLAGATGNNGSHILYLLDKLDLNPDIHPLPPSCQKLGNAPQYSVQYFNLLF